MCVSSESCVRSVCVCVCVRMLCVVAHTCMLCVCVWMDRQCPKQKKRSLHTLTTAPTHSLTHHALHSQPHTLTLSTLTLSLPHSICRRTTNTTILTTGYVAHEHERNSQQNRKKEVCVPESFIRYDSATLVFLIINSSLTPLTPRTAHYAPLCGGG